MRTTIERLNVKLRRAREEREISQFPRRPLIGLGLPSGAMSTTEGWAPNDHKHHDVKATSTRKKKAAKTVRATIRGRECDATFAPNPKYICELSKDGTACGKKFARKEHRERHWDSGCKIFPWTKEAPRCVIELHCAVEICKELKSKRPDNMVQHCHLFERWTGWTQQLSDRARSLPAV